MSGSTAGLPILTRASEAAARTSVLCELSAPSSGSTALPEPISPRETAAQRARSTFSSSSRAMRGLMAFFALSSPRAVTMDFWTSGLRSSSRAIRESTTESSPILPRASAAHFRASESVEPRHSMSGLVAGFPMLARASDAERCTFTDVSLRAIMSDSTALASPIRPRASAVHLRTWKARASMASRRGSTAGLPISTSSAIASICTASFLLFRRSICSNARSECFGKPVSPHPVGSGPFPLCAPWDDGRGRARVGGAPTGVPCCG